MTEPAIVWPRTCVLCRGPIEGYGHNPAPVRDEGRCCDDCNHKVVGARLDILLRGERN